MRRERPDIPTADGTADAYFCAPDGGRFPAVLLCMDGIGLRPRLEEMADRIAAAGYAVLVPNLFYRGGRAPLIPNLAERLRDEDRATVLAPLRPLIASLTADVVARDARSYLDFLDSHSAVRLGPVAVTGYCMGAGVALRVAAELPDRVAAAAGFHGDNLAPDDPAGPQHGAPRIRAELYFGHADNDPSLPPEQVARLAEALTAAGVRHTAEVYAGASHGYTMSDTPAFNAAAEARHWDALLALLERALPSS